jgi:uroporphyrinogen decarboxylase
VTRPYFPTNPAVTRASRAAIAPYMQAAAGQSLADPPVWLMRQAGRYLPEYLAVRQQYDFLTVCRTPELICEVTLQPIRRFGFDAAILFSDILLPLVPMGADLSFDQGHGPRLHTPLRDVRDFDKLHNFDPAEELAYVLTAIRQLRAELPPEVALIGFAGAPFTLACYLIEGGKPDPFANVKRLMYDEPRAFESLLAKLAEMTLDYLRAQVDAGCDAVQLFDTWAGILPETEYRATVLPVVKSIFAGLDKPHLPRTYYALNNSHLLTAIAESGSTVAGLDWRVAIPAARRVLGFQLAIQGNLDPTVLFANEQVIRAQTRRIITEARGTGFIFNLGHGILPNTPIQAVEIMLDELRGGESL